MMHEGNYDWENLDNSQCLQCTLDPWVLVKEEIEQAPSWKQDSILGQTVDWIICPVSMEMTYQLENRVPKVKSPRART